MLTASPAAWAGEVPRFASLRAAEVNLRTGPGVRYPVEWVYVRRDLPVEITAEFATWRKVRDRAGTVGWVHQSMLSGRRTMIVTGGRQPLYRDADAESAVLAMVEPKVIGRLMRCAETWCRVEIAGLRGWLRRDRLWGVHRGEKFE